MLERLTDWNSLHAHPHRQAEPLGWIYHVEGYIYTHSWEGSFLQVDAEGATWAEKRLGFDGLSVVHPRFPIMGYDTSAPCGLEYRQVAGYGGASPRVCGCRLVGECPVPISITG